MHRAERDEFKTRRKSRSRRRAKNQAPNPKLQRSSKSQAPNPKNRCRGKWRAGRFLSLELGASLELGVWNLALFAWALSFSIIETRPPSLDLGKAEDGPLEKSLCFVQIRVNLANPNFTPEEVATGLGAQEPP